MSTHILPSQSFKPAQPFALGQVAKKALVVSARFFYALAYSLRRPQRAGRRLSLLEEANEVRAMAAQYRRTDPGFAADLMAAADRHEQGIK